MIYSDSLPYQYIDVFMEILARSAQWFGGCKLKVP